MALYRESGFSRTTSGLGDFAQVGARALADKGEEPVIRVPDYNWDDVAEPTDEDLAEVDAALAAVGPSSVSEGSMRTWGQNAKVKLAMRAVGPPRGPDWIVRFSSALFAITEATEKLGIDKLLQATNEWDQFCKGDGHQGGTRRSSVIYGFLAVGMTIEATASYLGTTPAFLCSHLTESPASAMLEADRLLRAGDVTVMEVAARTGVPERRLRKYTKRTGILTASQRRKADQASDECKARGIALGLAGMKTREIVNVLTDEFPDDERYLGWDAVHKWVKRAEAA